MQQFLKASASNRPIIAVDQREDIEFDRILKEMGANVDRQVLEVGDFLCSSRLVIERKTRQDFEQSVIDGRLFSQLPNLISNYDRVVVLVEGTADDGRLKRASLLGAYTSILADYGASLIFTRDRKATAELVFHFAKHEQLAKKQPLRIFAKRKSLTPSQTCRSIVEMLPMVGPKLARNLLNHFGNVQNIVEANERELLEVPGMGKKRAKLIKEIFSYKYIEEDDSNRY